MKVKIPFKFMFREAMLNGTKTLTSRTCKYGEVGDDFDAFGSTFEIIGVGKMTLSYVAFRCFKEEGCISKEHFIKVWEDIHPRKGFVPSQKVWVHSFRKLSVEA